MRDVIERRQVVRVTWGITAVVLLLGCAAAWADDDDDDEVPGAVANAAARARLGNLSTQGLSRVTFDLNRDGTPDQVHYSRGGIKVRVERDFNFDGRVDTFEHYEGEHLVEEEMDLDFDGQIDVVRAYGSSALQMKRYAMGFDQQLITTLYYDPGGGLERIERDTNDDRRVDIWEYYRGGAAKPFMVEIDLDYDGEPDRSTTEESPAKPSP